MTLIQITPFLVALSLVIGGCASPSTIVASGSASAVENEAMQQQVLALSTEHQRVQRLNKLYWPLRKENVELCGDNVVRHSGFSAIQRDDFPRDIRAAATQWLSMGDELTALNVTEGAPAWIAGLRPGDRIVAINDEDIGVEKGAVRRFQKIIGEAMKTADDSYSLKITRNGMSQTLTVTPVSACVYEIMLDSSDALNAYADGTNIYITAGMYRFVDTDEELQLVIAHELAHNSEGHINKKIGNSLLGSVFDIAAAAYGINTGGVFGNAGAAMYSQEFEAEADYVGLYMMARAGVSTVEAANFWRRMAAENPGSIKGSYSSTHPATAERWVNIDAAEREIQQKKDGGKALLPVRE